MPLSFAERLNADRRLVILRLLSEQIAYKASSSNLTLALDHLGHALSRDLVKTQLHWLAEQGLVELDEGLVLVAKLTERGLEVAEGRVIAPGVARPGP